MSVQFKDNTARSLAEIERRASALVKQTALGIEAEVKSDMAGPKRGRTYRRKGKTHTASAPGEAPAIDQGVLLNSVQTEMDGNFAAEVGSPQETAPILEDPEGLNRPAWKRAEGKAKNTFQRNAQKIR